MASTVKFSCPVCGTPLSENEYYKALGLWEEKQKHIKHLEAEQTTLREQAKKNREKINAERRKLQARERIFKARQASLRARHQKALAEQGRKTRLAIRNERALTARKLKQQRRQIERSVQRRMQETIKTKVKEGVEQQKTQLKKQETELRKTNNK